MAEETRLVRVEERLKIKIGTVHHFVHPNNRYTWNIHRFVYTVIVEFFLKIQPRLSPVFYEPLILIV